MNTHHAAPFQLFTSWLTFVTLCQSIQQCSFENNPSHLIPDVSQPGTLTMTIDQSTLCPIRKQMCDLTIKFSFLTVQVIFWSLTHAIQVT